MYKAKYKSYGTFAELGDSGFLKDIIGNYDYTYTCVADNNSYTAISTPEDNRIMSTYRVTQTGILEVKHPGQSEFKPYYDED